MRAAKLEAFSRFYSLYPVFPTVTRSSFLPRFLISLKTCLFCTSTFSNPKNPAELFTNFGCSDVEVSKIFQLQPSLLNARLTTLIPKLSVLLDLGITGSDLVQIIKCRTCFFASRIDHDLDNRLNFLHDLFQPKGLLRKAILRNPSILFYDYNQIKTCVSLYEELGITKQELVPLIVSRPMIILRSSLCDEKREYINKTGISSDSKMYKYIVSLVAISRIDTILEKVTNLEKFGLSSEQVMSLQRKSPVVLTLSTDKVQRNMTFIIGTLKLPSTVILQYPFLVLLNLETVVKPRYLVGEKIISMGLSPEIKGPGFMTALRMTEPRFLKVFVTCHPKSVADQLMKVYTNAKGKKRLAENSWRSSQGRLFPF